MERGMFDENFRLGNILNEANIGLWYIELEEGSTPRMYGDCAMLELLGIEGFRRQRNVIVIGMKELNILIWEW